MKTRRQQQRILITPSSNIIRRNDDYVKGQMVRGERVNPSAPQ